MLHARDLLTSKQSTEEMHVPSHQADIYDSIPDFQSNTTGTLLESHGMSKGLASSNPTWTIPPGLTLEADSVGMPRSNPF